MPDERVRSLTRDLVRFAVVGGFGFVVDVVLFNALRATVLHDGTIPAGVLIAKVIATAAAILTNWMGNRWWTFRDRRRSSAFAEAAAFFAVSVVGSLLSLACLAVSHYALGLTSAFADNVSANVVGLLLGSLFRFVVSRHWVFRADRAEPTPLVAPQGQRSPAS